MSSKKRYLQHLRKITSKCCYCDTICTKDNVSVEHIIPRVLIKNDVRFNLTAACQNCNRVRGKITEYILKGRLTTKEINILNHYISIWNCKVIQKHIKTLCEFRQELNECMNTVIAFYYEKYGYR